MPHYLLRVEAVNLFANLIDDTDDLSTRRGGGLLALNAVGQINDHIGSTETLSGGHWGVHRAVHVRCGGHSAPPGIDAPMARDALDRYMLPFSLVKGKVLDAFCELRPNDPKVREWLGRTSGGANRDYDPERGRVRFGKQKGTATTR